MQRYMFTVKIASRNGAPTQLVIAEHGAPNMDALMREMNQQDFITVHQLHKARDGSGELEAAGETILNIRTIGKVRELLDRPGFNNND